MGPPNSGNFKISRGTTANGVKLVLLTVCSGVVAEEARLRFLINISTIMGYRSHLPHRQDLLFATQ